ncbi:hydroxymethylglutaryl-CoA lyase [Pedobacter deserti]|uniref:hydroxymethylglutaryl-CoA lyase n=1 Tax=Pedobacter deserti TaxID=2817382 RepID=UPI00210D0720|nr:hydroxymethylglutaryl-CoA lyase [Pedobacter sp. SYSU D00382]
MKQKSIKLVECPRDAMQGIHDFIPTELKAQYINLLLGVGFDTIDFGSFVSAKAIPQLKDTREVLSKLDLTGTKSKLLAIVANLRGAEEASAFDEISYLGFPFSISETFQRRNTNSGILESVDTVKALLEICDKRQKTAVVYLSMGFGNPYGDPWNTEIVEEWTDRLVGNGVTILALSDTIGVSSPEKIREIVPPLLASFSNIEIGLHLHSTPATRLEKMEAAFDSGCVRFDSALRGYGGCPMAADDLTGNMATEDLIDFFRAKNIHLNLDMEKWTEAVRFSSRIFH